MSVVKKIKKVIMNSLLIAKKNGEIKRCLYKDG